MMKVQKKKEKEVLHMSKKYESLAETIVEKVGGIDNISAVRHCQTPFYFAGY